MRPYWPWYLPSPPPKPGPRRPTQPPLPVAREDARSVRSLNLFCSYDVCKLTDNVALIPERINDYVGIYSTLKQRSFLVGLDSDAGEL